MLTGDKVKPEDSNCAWGRESDGAPIPSKRKSPVHRTGLSTLHTPQKLHFNKEKIAILNNKLEI